MDSGDVIGKERRRGGEASTRGTDGTEPVSSWVDIEIVEGNEISSSTGAAGAPTVP